MMAQSGEELKLVGGLEFSSGYKNSRYLGNRKAVKIQNPFMLKIFIRRDKAKFVWFPLAQRSCRISCKVRERLFDRRAISTWIGNHTAVDADKMHWGP